MIARHAASKTDIVFPIDVGKMVRPTESSLRLFLVISVAGLVRTRDGDAGPNIDHGIGRIDADTGPGE